MDMLLGLLLMGYGIFTVVKKELKLSNEKTARGTPAVLAGVLLILALPIAFLAQMALTALSRAGTPLVGDITQTLLTYATLAVVTVVALVVAFRGTRPA
jgi:hypothetical protein